MTSPAFLSPDNRIAFKIALIYAVFSVVWILFSDQVLFYFVKDADTMVKLQTVKGWLFVLTTAMLIFFLLKREIKKYLRTQVQLKQLRNLLSSVVNSMHSILVSVDSEGKVIQWNKEAEKATDINAEDAKGQMLDDLLPWHSKVTAKIKDSVKSCRILKHERFSSEVNGEIKYYDANVFPLKSKDVEGAVIRVDDISERVQLELLMIHTEKMMTLGGLAAGMAHEINNPLGIVLQGAQNISRRLSTGLKKNQMSAEKHEVNLENLQFYLKEREVLETLDEIRKAGKRAADIIANMLAFSRKNKSRKYPVDIVKTLENTIELAGKDFSLMKKYDFRQVKIERDYAPNLDLVPCVETEIEQVFLNLFRNATQAMSERNPEEGSRIVLRTRLDTDMARLEVEDNGPGMNEATKKRIFEPFFTTKPAGQGTGLGLSVSHMIIKDNHQGTMEVESEPGKGARFVIRLPLEA